MDFLGNINMKIRILSVPFAVMMLLCGQNAFSMNDVTTRTNMNNQRSFEVLRNISIDDNVLNTLERRHIEKKWNIGKF